MLIKTSMAIFSAAIPLFCALNARAAVVQPLPSANYLSETSSETDGGLQEIHQQFTGPTAVLASGSAGSYGSHSSSNASIYSQPSPILTTYAQQSVPFPPLGNGNATGDRSISASSATLNYYFRVIGPDGNVPVLVKALGTIAITPNSAGLTEVNAYASLSIGSIVNDAVGFHLGQYGAPQITQMGTGQISGSIADGGVSGDFKENSTYLFQANTEYNVSLSSSVYGNIFASHAFSPYDTSVPGGVLKEYSFIDPTFSIAASEQSSLYSIEISQGVGNIASGVPEASTWMMALIGFAALAGFSNIRRGRSGAKMILA